MHLVLPWDDRSVALRNIGVSTVCIGGLGSLASILDAVPRHITPDVSALTDESTTLFRISLFMIGTYAKNKEASEVIASLGGTERPFFGFWPAAGVTAFRSPGAEQVRE
ncbi:hypothetical protein E4U32_007512 [Claviceps aff. humidiphila group G2b]|nr:hypothetical protein E4U32_007512 [Claviceps aff. humidiphila group G2b]